MNPSSFLASGTARDQLVLGLALALQLAVLAWDVVTPRGQTEWVFHLLPVSLLLLQQRRWPPLALVLGGWVALWVGYELSPNPSGIHVGMAGVNRMMGGLSLAAVGLMLTLALRQRRDTRRMAWVQQGKATLSQRVAGEGSPEAVGTRIVQALCEVTGARLGVLYRVDGERLCLCGSSAADVDSLPPELPLHGGLAGQVLGDPQVQWLSPAPAGHLVLRSALGRSEPAHLVLMPVRAEGSVLGVVELGFAGPQVDLPMVSDLCTRSVELLGLALRAAVYRVQMQAMLEEAQCQAEELQAQQEELRVNNEELEEQGRMLRESQAALEAEHNELTRSNAQLEVQTQSLAQQKAALQRAHLELQQQTDALAAASRYKSEFLANMSHELRTPLNSALILSRLLVDNREGTLTTEQVQYAQAIHEANKDLLALINDILDLSKVEAGHAGLRHESVHLADLVSRLRTTFEPLARERQLRLDFRVADEAPATLVTDGQRLQQVLKNLLANALKFTRQGGVALHIGRSADGQLQFDVVDTGLGIAAAQHQVIFEAFRQADGSTSRQFGGTGLGLSISRELVQRMGGAITLRSAPGEGSTFTVRLPAVMPTAAGGSAAAAAAHTLAVADPAPPPTPVPPATGVAHPGAPPASAAPPRRVLVVEDDTGLRDSLRSLLTAPQVAIHTAGTVAEALDQLARNRFDCLVTDLALPDGSGGDLIERLAAHHGHGCPPVIVYTGRALSAEEELRLRRHSHAIIVKGERSPERLLDEVAQFLRQQAPQPPGERPGVPARSRERDAVLEGRTLLLAEDDVRNVFALTSVFEQHGLRLVLARNGREAVAALERQPAIDLVLMDIMMPEMDGLEAMRRIRARPEHATLPIIALTAKAMADDRQQCLAAGASDYLAKPIDPQRLLSLCRVWMPR